MKTIIAGSRVITNYKALEAVMKDVQAKGLKITQVVSGMAPGVDMLGIRWAKDNGFAPEDIIRMPADWDKYGQELAGRIRNTEMAQMADACVLLWNGKSTGTKHMMLEAKAHSLQTFMYPLAQALRLYQCHVVNIQHTTCDVFIGRGSIWGNPFVQGKDGTREEVILDYADWLAEQPHLLRKLPSLKGKSLGCYCYPQPCHGDVLAAIVNKMPEEHVPKRRPRPNK